MKPAGGGETARGEQPAAGAEGGEATGGMTPAGRSEATGGMTPAGRSEATGGMTPAGSTTGRRHRGAEDNVCGICGEIRFDGRSADVTAVARMTDAMESRGPDSDGVVAHGPVALGHRRLSIIDLSA